MSWLTDLAGKAEDFLVKIDKNAAVAAQAVLTKDRITPSHSRRDSGASVASVASVTSISSDFSSSHGQQTAPSINFKSSASMSDVLKAGKTKVDLDATLMASLNGSCDVLDASNIHVGNSNHNNDLSLQHENNLLKQEIKSLSQEIRQSMQHAKQAQKGLK